MMPIRPSFLPIAAGLALFCVARAEDVVPFNEIATIHQEVVIPVPAEIFNVLDKSNTRKSDWDGELRVPTNLKCKGLPHSALFLGSVVAEGFLAVEAENSQAVTDLGKAVLDLASTLGLEEAVLKHSKIIIESAKKGEWERVRMELDATRKTVNEEMDKRRDQDLAHCVSVGGWIRGTQAVASLVKRDFSPERAELLHQPDLVEHLRDMMKKLEKDARAAALAKGLNELLPFMSKENPSAQDVAKIHEICGKMLNTSVNP